MMDPALLLLDEQDNVVVVRKSFQAGAVLLIDGVECVARTDVAIGHKVARADLLAGAPILKFGARIGVLTKNVARGEHVHSHNLASEYMPAHYRGGGSADR